MMRLRALLIIMCLAISMIPVAIIGGFQGFEIATAFLGLIVLVTFFVSLIMSYFISRSLEKLTKNIDERSRGNLEVEMEKSEIFEVNKLTNSLKRVMVSLKLAIHKVGVKKSEIFEETIKAKEEAEEKIKELNKELLDMKERMRDVLNELEKFKYKQSRKRTMDKLTEEEFNAMYIFDENANIVDCDKNMYEKLGYKKDEMLSLKLSDFDYLETKKDFKDKIFKIKKQGEINLKTIHKKKNGSSIFVSENIQYLKDKNMFKCIVKEDL
ncbi:MAG: PAS domain S-box protein [Thermoplasmatales archaeon]|nr:MAG: PAS domain S-box protein [Thermoplasmatales archaeon]